MVSPIDIFDQLSDTAEGRRIGFETFLNRFTRQGQPRGVGQAVSYTHLTLPTIYSV